MNLWPVVVRDMTAPWRSERAGRRRLAGPVPADPACSGTGSITSGTGRTASGIDRTAILPAVLPPSPAPSGPAGAVAS